MCVYVEASIVSVSSSRCSRVHRAGQVAGRFEDGVWLCELAPVRDQIRATLAGALGLAPGGGAAGEEMKTSAVRIGLAATLFRDTPDALVQTMMRPFRSLMESQTGLTGQLVTGMQPTEPLTFAAIISVLVIAALSASFVPARRASRADPMKVLRQE